MLSPALALLPLNGARERKYQKESVPLMSADAFFC
jgi:hypothetical protein